MKLNGRGISRGTGEGEVLLLQHPFSFLGGVDPKTGRITAAAGKEGIELDGTVFAFPRGKGSTVGSYTILQLKREGHLPAAIINQRAETIVATGAVMAGIPMVDSIDLSLLRDGDMVRVDGEVGTVELPKVRLARVVTSVLTNKGKVLMLKRSHQVSTNRGMWAAVSGYIEEGEEPLETAVKEIGEETGIAGAKLIKSCSAIMIRQEDILWEIHPFLFGSPTDRVTIDWEHTEYRWCPPSEIEGDASVVPGLKRLLGDLGL
jgi:predicted aconitase with swiveling domain/8-oxo-dGTP pyrophosphatase MutT (NUDIX family)